MADDFDAAAFAQRATGGSTDADVEDSVANHADAEGAADASSEDVGRLGTWKEMALQTEPNIPLEEVDDPWNPEQGGTARIFRGILKATGADGMPAIADVAIGAIEVAHKFKSAVSSSSSSSSDDGEDTTSSSATVSVDGQEVPVAQA